MVKACRRGDRRQRFEDNCTGFTFFHFLSFISSYFHVNCWGVWYTWLSCLSKELCLDLIDWNSTKLVKQRLQYSTNPLKMEHEPHHTQTYTPSQSVLLDNIFIMSHSVTGADKQMFFPPHCHHLMFSITSIFFLFFHHFLVQTLSLGSPCVFVSTTAVLFSSMLIRIIVYKMRTKNLSDPDTCRHSMWNLFGRNTP